MSDKEMRIKIKVDNTEVNKSFKELGKKQDKDASSAKSGGTSGMASGLDAVGKSAGGLVGKLGGLGKAWVSMGTGIGTFTAGLTPMTAALTAAGNAIKAAAGFAKDSIMDYSTFEGTLKQVQIIAGGTQADMDMLGDTAIEIGSKTSKGAQEVANAMVDFAKLGFTAKETSEAMKGIVYAAEASGSSVDTTAGIVATALNVWNMEASKAEHVADVLAKTANETAADMTDMGYVLQYAGSSASLAGASLEQLSAMAGIMSDNGIKGSKAGTSLRTAFTNLINPTDAAAAAMEGLGVQFKDAEGKARPTMDVIFDLQDAVKGMDDIQIQELSTILFGKTGAAGMSFILKDTKENLNELTDSLVNSTGTAAKQAAEMRQTMEGQLDQLGDSVDAIKLKIGKALTEAFALDAVKLGNKFLDEATAGLDEFGKGYERTNSLLERSDGLISGTKTAKAFSSALRDMGTDFNNIPIDASMSDIMEWNNTYGTATSQALAHASSIKNFSFLPENYLEGWTAFGNTISSTVSNAEVELAAAKSSMSKGGSADVSGMFAQRITESIPEIQAGMQQQLAVFGEANQSRLNATKTFLDADKNLTVEQKAEVLGIEMVHGQQMQDTISTNNNQILELYKSLGQQDVTQREATMEQIRNLQSANDSILTGMAQAQSDTIVQTLEAQVASTGMLTQQQADEAVAAANQQADETIVAAQRQHVESVNAINAMSDEAVAKTGYTRDELIRHADTQMTETVGSAETMRAETVSKIQGMADKANEVDGTNIKINSEADTSSAVESLGALAAKINGVFDAFGKAQSAIQGKVDVFEGWIAKGDAWIAEKTGIGAKKKARGGITSGVGYGVGGNARYSPNATAVGSGNQLGQAGFSQGVISNERGREVTMPIQNATYMRPFAAAVAREMSAMGGGNQQAQTIYVPVYLDSREIAVATNDATADVNRLKTQISNRAKGNG